jgi:putative Mg2+ transporter-C (MgtC) family protein
LLGFGPTNNPMLIAGGVVTGIGFIGGGVIMHRGGAVQGINTAATLWATASIGLALGGGYYALGSLIALNVLAVQVVLTWAESQIDKRRTK